MIYDLKRSEDWLFDPVLRSSLDDPVILWEQGIADTNKCYQLSVKRKWILISIKYLPTSTYKDLKRVGTRGKLDFLIASRHRCKLYQDHHEFNETLVASKTRWAVRNVWKVMYVLFTQNSKEANPHFTSLISLSAWNQGLQIFNVSQQPKTLTEAVVHLCLFVPLALL